MTVSPASWADLSRHVTVSSSDSSCSSSNDSSTAPVSSSIQLVQQQQKQWTALWHRYLHVSAVLDGNVPLQTSRDAAADEFVRAYRQQSQQSQHQQSQQQQQPTSSSSGSSVNDTTTTNNTTTTTTTTFDKHYDDWEGTVPSVAVNSTETQFFHPSTTGQTTTPVPIHQPRTRQSLPLISATCPAIVCLVEKTAATTTNNKESPSTTTTSTSSSSSNNNNNLVSHLSTVPSPMTVAAQFWRRITSTTTNRITTNHPERPQRQIFHLAVMPCHDKKLEASRHDFVRHPNVSDVTVVITTNELVQLLLDEIVGPDNNDNNNSGRKTNPTTHPVQVLQEALGQQSTASVVVKYVGRDDPTTQSAANDEAPILWTLAPEQLWLEPLPLESSSSSLRRNPGDTFFALGAGGYADYIFRRAALDLFGVDLFHNNDDDETVWHPVTITASSSTQRATTSARTAQRRREHYQAVLVQCRPDDDESIGTTFYRVGRPNDDNDMDQVVLRFGIAYGMSTVPAVLMQSSSSSSSQPPPLRRSNYDYLEVMACPQGACLNGNGSLVQTSLSSERETPTETRQRVQATRQHFVALRNGGATTIPAKLEYYTRYHVVPAMQHSRGAAAGVKVQDTQW